MKTLMRCLLVLVIVFFIVGCATISQPNKVPPITGYVIYREDDEVVTDLGQNSNVRPGDTLVVLNIDSEIYHPVTNKLIRVRLVPLGVIHLEEVGNISSSGKIVSGKDKIGVGQFVRVVSKRRIPTEAWWEEGMWWKSLMLKSPTKIPEAVVPILPIANPPLEAAIRKALNKTEGLITDEEFAELAEFDASNQGISYLTGIERCINLQWLDLRGNQITDISLLTSLTNLRSQLWLDHNQINDITPLSNLTNLQELGLSGNQIGDITPLSSLTNLRGLSLSGNQISDFSPLSSMTSLQWLHLRGSHISDISPLSNLINLQELYLDGNQISDITSLSNLTNLQRLELGGNQISDISPLSNLTNLKWLWLNKNQIANISPLDNLTNPRELRLVANQISDISPLVSNSGIGEGDEIDLRGNPLNDEAYGVYIPALQERGVKLLFDPKP